jgi:hypothetical protein
MPRVGNPVASSRHWREKGIEFFFDDAGQLLLCLWLDWEARWVVWRMSDGKMEKATSAQTKAFNIEGRRRALAQAESDDFAPAALNFLGGLRFKEDRPFVEKWLRDLEFFTGTSQMTTFRNCFPELVSCLCGFEHSSVDVGGNFRFRPL